MKRPDGAWMTKPEMAETIQRQEASLTALRVQLDEKDEEIRRLKGEIVYPSELSAAQVEAREALGQ